MDITSLSAATPGAARPAPAAPALTSDFDTFIRMLTAQARFQDPLKPLDSAQYAAQLAQFSMVEQQVLTNRTLEGLNGGPGGLAQYAGWVGMDARSAGPVRFDGTPITVTPEIAPGADAAELVVSDAAGTEIGRYPVPVGRGPFEWTGAAEGGGLVPPGNYHLRIDSIRAGETVSQAPVQTYAAVVEVQVSPAGALLVLASGETLAPGAVTALRAPP